MPTRFIFALQLAPSSTYPDSWLHSRYLYYLWGCRGGGCLRFGPSGPGALQPRAPLLRVSYPEVPSAWRGGARGWVAGWQACGCSSALGCIAVAAPWPMGTQTPHATQAFNTIKSYLMQLMTRSYDLGCFWHSLVACWCLQHCCVTMLAFVAFTIVREHGGQIPVQRYVALAQSGIHCLFH